MALNVLGQVMQQRLATIDALDLCQARERLEVESPRSSTERATVEVVTERQDDLEQTLKVVVRADVIDGASDLTSQLANLSSSLSETQLELQRLQACLVMRHMLIDARNPSDQYYDRMFKQRHLIEWYRTIKVCMKRSGFESRLTSPSYSTNLSISDELGKCRNKVDT